jgi:PAS domain S-box-containing protein
MPYEINTKYVKYLVDGPIWEGMYKPDIPLIDLDIAHEIVRERLVWQDGKCILLLLHGEMKLRMTPEARAYLASQEGSENIAAAAILFNSRTMAAVLNFLLLFQAKNLPLATFQNRLKARQWLLKASTIGPEPQASRKSRIQQQFDHLFDTVPLMMFVVDEQERIVVANAHVYERLGYTASALIGQTLSAVRFEHLGQPLQVTFDKTRFPGGGQGYEEYLVIALEPGQGVPGGLTRLTRPNPAIAFHGLTETDLRVIRLLPLGLTSRGMAKLLGLSHRTVEFRRDLIKKKLNVDARNVAALIQKLNDLDLLGKNAY